MKRDRWKYHPVLKNWMNQEAVALGVEWERLIKDACDHSERLNEIIQAFQPVIETLVIRFHGGSKFFEIEQVAPCPEHLRQEVPCDHGSYWTDRLAEQKRTEDILWKEKEEKRRANYRKAHKGSEEGYVPLKNDAPNAHYRSRLCASFPKLMDFKDEKGKALTLTQQEFKANTKDGGIWANDKDPYYTEINEIVASSGKLQEVGRIIKKYRNFIDAEGVPVRLMFASNFFTGARCIYMVCSLFLRP